ncbi:Uncharacterized protein pbN1_03400 [Aromatoleum bremense]|nr:Uncharacterized protein pbN1_03400 [Aromatoleum bremense]
MIPAPAVGIPAALRPTICRGPVALADGAAAVVAIGRGASNHRGYNPARFRTECGADA